jgi:hypothetical protein
VNSRATRAGRTALRAVERDDDPETQAPLVHHVFVFRIVVTLIPPAAGRRRPAVRECLLVSWPPVRLWGRTVDGARRNVSTSQHARRARVVDGEHEYYLAAVRAGIRRRVVSYFEYRDQLPSLSGCQSDH